MTTLVIDSPEQMAGLGALLATQLTAGDLVLLNGELGAGKTTLTRAIGEALGIRGTVTSPTFVLARTHLRLESADAAAGVNAAGAGSETAGVGPAGVETGVASAPPLVHVDAYRLSSAVELDDLDIDFESSIVVVEWGAGLLDGVSENWLNIDIVRPTGAGSVGAAISDGIGSSSSTGSSSGGISDSSASSDFSEEMAEPRTVTVTGFGPKWADLGWLSALSD